MALGSNHHTNSYLYIHCSNLLMCKYDSYNYKGSFLDILTRLSRVLRQVFLAIKLGYTYGVGFEILTYWQNSWAITALYDSADALLLPVPEPHEQFVSQVDIKGVYRVAVVTAV